MQLNLALSILNIVVSALLTVALFYIGSKAAKIDKLEDRLRAAANDAVDLRFGQLSTEMSGSVGTLNAVLAEVQRRLAKGDDQFDRDNERRQRLELKTLQQIEEIKGAFATREDFRRLESQISKLNEAVAQIRAICLEAGSKGGRA